jgi:hypothetical protein
MKVFRCLFVTILSLGTLPLMASCETYYKEIVTEMRSQIVGSSLMPMTSHLMSINAITSVEAKGKSAQEEVCSSFLKKYKNEKSKNAMKATNVAPLSGSCQKLSLKFEEQCFKPLLATGKWKSKMCESLLNSIPVGIISNDNDHTTFFNEEHCALSLPKLD